MTTIAEAMAIALQHHLAGRLQSAEEIYWQVLAVEPKHADALHLLGIVAHQAGDHEHAIEYIRQAIACQGNAPSYYSNLGEVYRASRSYPEAIAAYRRALELEPHAAATWSNLGLALQDTGELEQAIASYRRALALDPGNAQVQNKLGNALQEKGELDEAIRSFRRALELQPAYAEAYCNLGGVLKMRGALEEAVDCLRRAVQLKPEMLEANHNLGLVLHAQGKLDDAVASFRRALQLNPNSAEAHFNLGNAILDQERFEEAVITFRRALHLEPDFAEAHNSLGMALKELGRFEESLACFQRSLQLNPDLAETHNNLGNALKDQGMLDEAIAAFRRATDLRRDYSAAHSNLLYGLTFQPDCDEAALEEEHREWNRKFAEPWTSRALPHSNVRTPQRRLRIGYVSPNFRWHPVGRFMTALLESHDHQNFEIFSYADVVRPDHVTARLRENSEVWRSIAGVGDDQVAQRIRQDGIDILVDLTMHLAYNRLLVFARRPAPVQVTYLAYCGTTGLRAMDYRLTDVWLDPPNQSPRHYSERSVWLPETYWCYTPPPESPPVSPLPASKKGHVTFGCLNNFCKVSEGTLSVWSRLLCEVPDARLVLHSHPGRHQDHARQRFAQQGVSPERVTFVPKRPMREYLNTYRELDLALDPFPYGGGTTTCDAIWMGVPVVTLAGRTALGRGGVSILSNLGLPELVAHDSEQYVRIAVELARDLPRLGRLRADLRSRMLNSPLMDGPRFARHVEAAYRAMWRQWCGQPPAG